MHPIENIIDSSIEQIKKMIDVSTVIGTPIASGSDTMILPVSKVSVGFVVGGGEYGKMASAKQAAFLLNEQKGEKNNCERFPFAGTAAVGMCLKPLSFVAIENNDIRILPASQDGASDRIMDLLPRMLKSLEKLINTSIDCIKQKCDCNENSEQHACQCENNKSGC